MPNPLVYEVAPAATAWIIRLAGDSQSEAFASKGDAVARARELAARDTACVRVLNPAGQLEMEFGPPAPGQRE